MKNGEEKPKPHPAKSALIGKSITSYETARGLMIELLYWTTQTKEKREVKQLATPLIKNQADN